MKKFLLLFSLLLITLVSYDCGGNIKGNVEDSKNIVLNDSRISQEEINIQDNNGEAILSSNDQKLFLTYINNILRKTMDDVVGIKIESIEKGNTKNLIFYLEDSRSEERIPFAFVLSQNSLRGSPTFFTYTQTHSCAGATCNCCAFTRNNSGVIIGCECNKSYWDDGCRAGSRQKCSHTITSG